MSNMQFSTYSGTCPNSNLLDWRTRRGRVYSRRRPATAHGGKSGINQHLQTFPRFPDLKRPRQDELSNHDPRELKELEKRQASIPRITSYESPIGSSQEGMIGFSYNSSDPHNLLQIGRAAFGAVV